MAEQPAPRAVGRQRDAAQVGVAHAFDAVVRGEALVQIRVVGVEQLEHAAPLAQDLGEQELGLAPKRRAQVRVEIRVLRRQLVELAQLQPLAREVLDEALRACVREHALDLRREHRRARAAAPPRRRASSSSSGMLLQRKNDSRDASSRSLMRVDVAGRDVGGLALEPVEEIRIDEQARQRVLDADLEVAAFLAS